jgi:hypothetical protein
MIRWRRLIFLASVIFGLIVLALHLRHIPADDGIKINAQLPVNRQAEDNFPTLKIEEKSRRSGGAFIKANRKPALSDDIRESFNKSRNLAAFVQEALSKPELGGHYYARMAVYECYIAPVASAAATSNKQSFNSAPESAIAAFEKLSSRCSNLSQQFPGDAIIRSIRDSRLGADPLLALARKGENLTSASGDRDFIQLLDAANILGDPNLTAQILNYGAFDIVKRIEPKLFKSDAELQAAQQAAASVACELSGDCEWGTASLLACLEGLDCKNSDDRIIYRSQVPPEQLAAHDRALEIFRRLVGLGS